jgi:hypothetical protein
MQGHRKYAVYILASRKYGALYIGVTGNLIGRTIMHREEWLPGFTAKCHIHRSSMPSFARGRRGDPAGEAAEEVAAGMEDRSDRAVQCRSARFVRCAGGMTKGPRWGPFEFQ